MQKLRTEVLEEKENKAQMKRGADTEELRGSTRRSTEEVEQLKAAGEVSERMGKKKKKKERVTRRAENEDGSRSGYPDILDVLRRCVLVLVNCKL